MDTKVDIEEKIIVDPSIRLDLIGRVILLVSEAPYFAEKNARVNKIEPLPGGLTNYNFKVTVDGEDYALRIAGDGTIEYLDRVAEKHNATLMAEMGINAPVVYYDEKTGNQICKYIDGITLHIPDFKNLEYLKQAANIFKKYHYCGKEFKSRFDPIKTVDDYNELLMKKNAELFEGYERVQEKLSEIKKIFEENPRPLAPCHNDPLPENYIVDDTGMYLIDWEYSGMNDPIFDVGDFAVENKLDAEQEKVFLREYFGGHVTRKQYGLYMIHKFLCDALWSIWALLQIATGKPREEYWPYGLERFERCVALMESEDFDRYLQAVRENSEEIVF